VVLPSSVQDVRGQRVDDFVCNDIEKVVKYGPIIAFLGTKRPV
jgi:hypothetical protein